MTPEIQTAKTIFHIIDGLVNMASSGSNAIKTTSLIDATKPARVEPLAVVSKDCKTIEYLPDVMQCLLSIFTGYYLQAVALTTQIDGVKVVRILDKLNPDRDFALPAFESYKDHITLVEEAYKFKLPRQRDAISLEESLLNDTKTQIDTYKKMTSNGTAETGKEATKSLYESSSLAVGKFIDVTININNTPYKIPVSVRLIPSFMNPGAIANLLALKRDDTNFVERYHQWRSGRITFVKDFMLTLDLIEEHKKNLMNDDTGVYTETIRRANNSKKYGLLSANVSMATASNLYIITETVAKEVEQKLGGKLSSPRIRDKAFESTYSMIIAVIDREWERVTFYFRGINMATEVSIKEIKSSNKQKGPDIMDMMKMLQMGSSVSF